MTRDTRKESPRSPFARSAANSVDSQHFANAHPYSEELSLRDLLDILFKHKILALIVFLVALAVGSAYGFFRPIPYNYSQIVKLATITSGGAIGPIDSATSVVAKMNAIVMPQLKSADPKSLLGLTKVDLLTDSTTTSTANKPLVIENLLQFSLRSTEKNSAAVAENFQALLTKLKQAQQSDLDQRRNVMQHELAAMKLQLFITNSNLKQDHLMAKTAIGAEAESYLDLPNKVGVANQITTDVDPTVNLSRKMLAQQIITSEQAASGESILLNKRYSDMQTSLKSIQPSQLLGSVVALDASIKPALYFIMLLIVAAVLAFMTVFLAENLSRN